METERGSITRWLEAFSSICTAFISASLMLVPEAGEKGTQIAQKQEQKQDKKGHRHLSEAELTVSQLATC